MKEQKQNAELAVNVVTSNNPDDIGYLFNEDQGQAVHPSPSNQINLTQRTNML